MMIDLALHPDTWDTYQDETGQLALVEGAAEVAQRCAVAIKTHVGEYIYDVTQGLPWREEILVRNPDLARIQDRIRTLIIGIQDVTSILSLGLLPDFTTRSLRIDMTVDTIYGPASLSVTEGT